MLSFSAFNSSFYFSSLIQSLFFSELNVQGIFVTKPCAVAGIISLSVWGLFILNSRNCFKLSPGITPEEERNSVLRVSGVHEEERKGGQQREEKNFCMALRGNQFYLKIVIFKSP